VRVTQASFVFVDDTATKSALADLYGQGFDPYAAAPRPEYPAGDSRGERAPRLQDSAKYLRDHFHEVPVMMIPFHEVPVMMIPA
jgi:hypothetical protein